MKFLALCPCDKVIFDKRDTPSLITLIQNVELTFTPADGAVDAELPRNAVAPREWFIYARWQSDNEDVGKTFEQVFQIFWPDGEKFLEHRLPMKPVVAGEDIQQSAMQMAGFPAGQSGILQIATWLDSDGHRVSDIIKCHIRVTHSAKQTTTDTTVTQ